MRTKMSEMLKFVAFDVVGEPKPITMALNVQKIKEVVEAYGLSDFPDASGNMLGIYDLRGAPIPVYDVLRVLSNGTRRSELVDGSRILICDLQKCLIGFPVVRTRRTLSCHNNSFLPPPRGGVVNGKKIVSGLIHKDDHYIPVLDLDSVLEMIQPEETEEASSAPAISNFDGKRVLIVEDSRTVLKKLTRLFGEMKFTIETAVNGEEGLALVEKSPAFDLIFTDIEMPLLDGIEMVRKIREKSNYQATPILFNSALSNPALIADIEQEELGRYIVKYDKDLIIAEVTKAMERVTHAA